MAEEAETMPKMPKISFGVKKLEDSKLRAVAKVVVDVEVDSDEEREKEEAEHQAKRRKLTHFEEGSFVGDKDNVKQVAVIPMVVEHDWRTQKLLEKEKEGTLTDEEKAKLALLVQSTSSEDSSNENQSASAIVVEAGGENIEDADYSAIPIESFGLAILRGCNWKDGDGIGKNPQKVALRLPDRRPPGLGLGATPKADPTKDKNQTKNGKEEKVGEIKLGSCLKIIDGRNKGLYGKVEGRDDDTNSLFVRLAIGSKAVKVNQLSVVAITTKEYEKDAKCLNKAEYDREKDKIEKQRVKKESDDYRGASTSKETTTSSKNGKEKSYEKKEEELWVRTDLLVRFIDDGYKNGKLYNQKVRVVDVAGRRDVSVEDDRGNTYYNIKQSWLETVIPRNIGEKLMIVGGKRRGQLAIMVEKDKKREKVTAKLVANSEIVNIYFEDVCSVSVRHEEDYE